MNKFTPLFHPVCNKNVRIPASAIVPVAAEYYPFTVWTEHGECIKSLVPGNFFHPGTVQVTTVHIKGEPTIVFMITAENEMVSVGCEIGCPVSLFQAGDLPCIRSVHISNPYFHICWRYHVICQQLLIFLYLRFCFRPGSPPDYF